jgi:hypothetical protein
MDPFLEYRNAHDEMEKDEAVAAAWDRVVAIQKSEADARADHDAACLKYRERMNLAAEEIRGAVLEQAKSVTLHNVEAKYTKGRVSVSWKSVADEVGAPPEIIAKHSKEGDPTVAIRSL